MVFSRIFTIQPLSSIILSNFGFSMFFYYLTIAIESMVLQSTIGDDGFSMVNEKNDRPGDDGTLRSV